MQIKNALRTYQTKSILGKKKVLPDKFAFCNALTASLPPTSSPPDSLEIMSACHLEKALMLTAAGAKRKAYSSDACQTRSLLKNEFGLVFISNSRMNEVFVLRRLLPNLPCMTFFCEIIKR